MAHFPFRDMREFDPDIAERIRKWAECSPCPRCQAALLQGMPDGFCCSPFGEGIKSNLPRPMNAAGGNRIIQLAESNQKFPRILNRDQRLVLQYACFSSPNAKASNLFISGIRYALDSYHQFTTLFMLFSVAITGGCQDDLVTSKR
jgi:hypothetical protein